MLTLWHAAYLIEDARIAVLGRVFLDVARDVHAAQPDGQDLAHVVRDVQLNLTAAPPLLGHSPGGSSPVLRVRTD